MAGQTEVQEGVTPQPDPKETSELVEAAELKGKSDALADVNRTLVEANKSRKASEAAEGRTKQMLKDYEESIRDDTARLDAFRSQETKRTADAELAKTQLELEEANEKVRLVDEEKAKSTMERNAREIATRLEVDPDRLVKLAAYTDKTVGAIEDIAKDLPKVEPRDPLNPDSNKSSGGSQSDEQIRENYRKDPDNPAVKSAYLEWRRRAGY